MKTITVNISEEVNDNLAELVNSDIENYSGACLVYGHSILQAIRNGKTEITIGDDSDV
jgi:hypothetical protein